MQSFYKDEIENPVLEGIWKDRYQKGNETYLDNIMRVAKHIGQDVEEVNEFYDVMHRALFFPAGRTMSNSGIGKNLTLNNCFVYPTIGDSMEEIFDAVKAGALTHKAGGGIGYDFSLLRPNGTPTNNDAVASGVVSFMDVFNAQTATVMQGSRRGANMGVLSIYHPDIEEFIYVKSQTPNRLNHFNLSVMIDDDFMKAVENKQKIFLHFPVYDEKYHIIKDSSQWKIVKEVEAIELWDKIIKLAYDNGEPGVLFYDNLNKLNNTWYTETITHTNPCGEYIAGTIYGQELNSNQYAGACNLGSLILPNYVQHPFEKGLARLNYRTLKEAIYTAVKMLDNIIDINNYPLKQYENYQKNMRTIGLGVTGLADTLVMLGYKYDTQEAVDFTDDLMNQIAIYAYSASIELAKRKGSFNFFNREKFLESGYLKAHLNALNPRHEEWETIVSDISKYGIRNARMLSVAPTGTLSLTYGENCSSGIEPIFSLQYDRYVKFGGQDESNKQLITIEDYAYHIWKTNYKDIENSNFVTALNMEVKDHVNMLAAIAKHVDMSVSKTINVPTEYSFEDTKTIYYNCWKNGVKGCTIFRPNEIRQGILIDSSKKEEKENKTEEKPINKGKVLVRGDWKEKASDTVYYQRKLETGCGKLKLFIGWSPSEHSIQDFYVKKSSEAGCERLTEAVAISMSAVLRLGGNLDNIEKALRGIGTCPSFARSRAKGAQLSKGNSCGVAIFNEVKAFYKEMENKKEEKEEKREVKKITIKEKTKDEKLFTCPECHESTLRYEGGCVTCSSCGWTKCG